MMPDVFHFFSGAKGRAEGNDLCTLEVQKATMDFNR